MPSSRASAILGLLLALGACGDEAVTIPDARPDARPDAPELDAATDAPFDAATDAPIDAAVIDAATDAPVIDAPVIDAFTDLDAQVPVDAAVIDTAALPDAIAALDASTAPGVANETDLPTEADYCNLQFPATLTATAGSPTELVYGRLYENGVTQPAGAPPGVIVELGYGPAGTDPTTQAGWLYFPAAWNVQVGNDDEFMRTLTVPAPGTYAYGFRISLDAGLTYTYCDADGAGSNAGFTFSASQLGLLTVGTAA